MDKFTIGQAIGPFVPPQSIEGWMGYFLCLVLAFAWWKWDAIKALWTRDPEPKDRQPDP